MLEPLKKSQNQLFQNNIRSENINEIQVNNSLINYRLKENAHSRALSTIPDENQNSFLVGLTQKGNNSELVKVIYDELNKKITHKTILDFNTEKEKEGKDVPQINEINKIYPKNATDFLLNVFNSTSDQYELKFFSENKTGLHESISCLDSNEIFDINFSTKSKNIFCIDKTGVKYVDIIKNSIISEIKYSDKDPIPSPMKISSDISILDENVLGCGLGQDIYMIDIREKKVVQKINDSHEGSVLCFQFDPVSAFGFCSSGTDFAIKFWDMRKPKKEFGGIYNNSHWIWDLKYNKSYSNVMVTASSSSLVRGIIFDKMEGNEDKNRISNLAEKNLKKYSFIDYFEFEDSVYSLDWMKNDTWSFVATSFNAYFHVNTIPEEVKNRIKF
jgi:WD40 repeat protein